MDQFAEDTMHSRVEAMGMLYAISSYISEVKDLCSSLTGKEALNSMRSRMMDTN